MEEALTTAPQRACRFCQIIRRDITSAIVFEGETSLAFLDTRPLFPGHCLLVPKAHVETLADLPTALVAPLFQNAQRIERAIEESLQAEGTFVAILASMIADPRLVSPEHMEEWVKDFDSWDVCDQVCGNLFDKTPYAYHKAMEWCHREQEFVRRAGFVLMAELAVHDKRAPDEKFMPFFPLIKQYAVDERNFVKKAVNWALRQIGKRNSHLRTVALDWTQEIKQVDSRAARWIANDALRELQKKAP